MSRLRKSEELARQLKGKQSLLESWLDQPQDVVERNKVYIQSLHDRCRKIQRLLEKE